MAISVVNPDGIPGTVIGEATQQIKRALASWNVNRSDRRRSPMSMFTRSQFMQPINRTQAIAAARAAGRNDVVKLSLEVVEGLALDSVGWESSDTALADAWNNSAAEVNLDFFVRQALWEMNTIGCVTVATWWGRTTTRSQPTAPGGRRRTISRTLPQRFTVLPAEKVVRVEGFWGNEKLIWLAEPGEYEQLLAGDDETSKRLVAGDYAPTGGELKQFTGIAGCDPDYALLLKSDNVWQSRLPGADYGNCDETPMTPILPWLEMQARLMDADRNALVGAANFILVFKVGTDLKPAQQAEVDAYREGMTRIAQMPVIVGDHRLNVEILTPDTTATLNGEKHAVNNHRIAASVLGLPDDAMMPDKKDLEMPARMMVARIKSRRRLLGRSLEQVARTGAGLNGGLASEAPSFTFTPREIPLVGVTALMNGVLAARSRRDMSRTTYLEALGYDVGVELERITNERDSGMDDAFGTHEPFDSPSNGGMPPGAFGPTGGRPAGDTTKPGEGKKAA